MRYSLVRGLPSLTFNLSLVSGCFGVRGMSASPGRRWRGAGRCWLPWACPGRGRASDPLRGRVLVEMYNAQLIGTWRRLKVCHNARCHEVFFDQSKNNSRTWFDTAACANALNLRAYRERRKAARFSDLSERDPG